MSASPSSRLSVTSSGRFIRCSSLGQLAEITNGEVLLLIVRLIAEDAGNSEDRGDTSPAYRSPEADASRLKNRRKVKHAHRRNTIKTRACFVSCLFRPSSR